jgi:vacuolar iron transporter family protein
MTKQAYLKGLGFGLTSGIITTLGMMVGMSAGTNSRLAVLGGILMIAVGDSLSDAMGMHVSEESAGDGKNLREVWVATFSTLFFKFIFASIFIIPVLLLSLEQAILVSVIFGLVLISVFSFIFANKRGEKPLQVVIEHVGITLLVIFLTHFVGVFVNNYFGDV